MRFKRLTIDNSIITQSDKIESALLSYQFYWLIDSEVEDAVIQIKNNTLIWDSGTYYSGRWYYGIWKSGDFHGVWENGIFEKGRFYGKFLTGIIPDYLLPKK